MWIWIVGFAALAPLLGLLPERLRLPAITAASAVGIALYDVRLAIGVVAGVAIVDGAMRWLSGRPAPLRRGGAALLLAAVAGIFVWNKLQTPGGGALPSQGGLVLVGYSYLALKLAGAVLDVLRGGASPASRGSFFASALFLPTYPSGPIEGPRRFAGLRPRPSAHQAAEGLERILVGLVKLLLVSSLLAQWIAPVLDDPAAFSPLAVLAAAHGFTLRFYLDFSGYSDIAIGAARVLGIEVQENFDWPLTQRNLARLWQRWHMTLTAWLRRYLFVPLSRGLMRRLPPSAEVLAVAVAQLVTMLFCGLWHGVSWGFVVWGLLQGLGLLWLAVAARPLGARLPDALRSWWRRSHAGHALSVVLTFHYFSFCNVFAVLPLADAFALLRALAP